MMENQFAQTKPKINDNCTSRSEKNEANIQKDNNDN